MIQNVSFNSTNIKAGDTLVINIDATYPVVIEIYCFVTQPPPTRFVPCPRSGSHNLEYKHPFNFQTSVQTFVTDGRLELRITDADQDFREYQIDVSGLNSPLAAAGA